jgi:hypothetical protein
MLVAVTRNIGMCQPPILPKEGGSISELAGESTNPEQWQCRCGRRWKMASKQQLALGLSTEHKKAFWKKEDGAAPSGPEGEL